MIERLVVIGVGLIGGSLARALRAAGAVREVVGVGRSLGNLEQAVGLGVVDRVETSAGRAVRDADVVVLAVPVGAMAAVFADIAPYLGDATVVTDVGSVKGSVAQAARAALGARFRQFVPGHPIAGTEQSGVTASFAELYRGRRVVLTPLPETDNRAVARVRTMWQQVGAEVVDLTPEHHDAVLAATSHLPHVLAFALVDVLARMDGSGELFAFAAGGFRDFTRIASSDPVMWRDICLANREAIARMLARYREELVELERIMTQGDGAELERRFAGAKQARDAVIKNDKGE